jgi:hypothetical protein
VGENGEGRRERGEGRKKLIATGYLLVIGIPNH